MTKIILVSVIGILIFTNLYFLKENKNLKSASDSSDLSKDSTITYLRTEKYIKDSVVMNADEFMPNSNHKDIVAFKKFYFKRNY